MNECAAAAGELTELVVRLGAAHQALVRQSRMPETDFSGMAGDAFRGHASRSADSAAEAASDLALLAAALARLGRELESAAELRAIAQRLPPGEAAETRGRADERERRAQADWRTAVAGYEQRRWPSDVPDQPVVSHPPIRPEPATAAPTLGHVAPSSGPGVPAPPPVEAAARPVVAPEPGSQERDAELVASPPGPGPAVPAWWPAGVTEAMVWPPRWRRRIDDVAVVATGPTPPGADGPPRLELRLGSATLDGANVVVDDEDRYDHDGHEVDYRRVGHTSGGVELISEEWRWVVDGQLLVLTATVPLVDYLDVHDLFEEVAMSVDPTSLSGASPPR